MRMTAPSLRSMSSQVSRTVARFSCGTTREDDVDQAIALNDPVGGSREGERDPSERRERAHECR